MTIGANPICFGCRYFEKPWTCKAFDEIPADIIMNKFIHTEKHPDQKGEVLFSLKEGADLPYALRKHLTRARPSQ